jgi:hypothetical protein
MASSSGRLQTGQGARAPPQPQALPSPIGTVLAHPAATIASRIFQPSACFVARCAYRAGEHRRGARPPEARKERTLFLRLWLGARNLVWRRRLSLRHKGYEAVIRFSSRDVEVAGVGFKLGCRMAYEVDSRAIVERERHFTHIGVVGEMRSEIEVRPDPDEIDDIGSADEIENGVVAITTVRSVEYEGVSPVSAAHGIVALSTHQYIIAGAADQIIAEAAGGAAGDQRVVAIVSRERAVADAVHGVITSSAVQTVE